jgi:hypothetical protein
MQRLSLFELEDFAWFPASLRASITRMITVMHRWLGTRADLTALLARVLREGQSSRVIDLCSGDGGPMLDVAHMLRTIPGFERLELVLTDRYPNHRTAELLAARDEPDLRYELEPMDATVFGGERSGVRTMVCSFHHMPPAAARQILATAQARRHPFCVYEMSDNSVRPRMFWWMGLPFSVVLAFVVAAFARPFTLRHFFFSYLVPIVPLCFAWDGAVSNVRTYTLDDVRGLIAELPKTDDYVWEAGTLGRTPMRRLYVLGLPRTGGPPRGEKPT